MSRWNSYNRTHEVYVNLACLKPIQRSSKGCPYAPTTTEDPDIKRHCRCGVRSTGCAEIGARPLQGIYPELATLPLLGNVFVSTYLEPRNCIRHVLLEPSAYRHGKHITAQKEHGDFPALLSRRKLSNLL